MNEQDKQDISNILSEVTNHLMINGSMVFISGLLYGKLGISLFFFHYARYTGNSLYEEYARCLVDLVKAQIHDDYPLDYERGLAGVGAGLDYLKKHGYYDVGSELMYMIDSKIIKMVDYERRVGLLTGFGRYLMSRYETNPAMKDSLIRLIDLLINPSAPVQTNSDSLSLLCDLCSLGIREEMIESCLSDSMDALIKDVEKEPISGKLFTLIKLSQIPSCSLCRTAACDALSDIFTKKRAQFADINSFQWLLQCEKLVKENEFHFFLPKIKSKIEKNIASFDPSKLDELFSNHQDFAFQGGYAGLGMALISILDTDHVSWINLLKI